MFINAYRLEYLYYSSGQNGACLIVKNNENKNNSKNLFIYICRQIYLILETDEISI